MDYVVERGTERDKLRNVSDIRTTAYTQVRLNDDETHLTLGAVTSLQKNASIVARTAQLHAHAGGQG